MLAVTSILQFASWSGCTGIVYLEPRVCSTPSPTLPRQTGGTLTDLRLGSGDRSLDADADLTVGVLIGHGDTLGGIGGLVGPIIALARALVAGHRLPH